MVCRVFCSVVDEMVMAWESWEPWEGVVGLAVAKGVDMDIDMRQPPVCGVCKHDDDEGGRDGEGAIGGKEDAEEVKDTDELMLTLLLFFWDPPVPVFPEFEEFKELGFVTINGGLIPVDFWDLSVVDVVIDDDDDDDAVVIVGIVGIVGIVVADEDENVA